tara:strand:- start:125 stop:373 length:249 start_codon:yes stop_codon:yes gene_type:complete
MDRDMINTLHAIHEHGITGKDQDGISATVTGVEEYVKEHMWQIIENQMLDAGIIQDTGDKAYAMIEIAVRELIYKLNTDKHR